MSAPLVNLRVPPHERAAWTRVAASGGVSLSRWIRTVCNEAVAAAELAVQEEVEVAKRRRRELERPARVRESEAWHRAGVAEAERVEAAAGAPGGSAESAESDPPAPVEAVEEKPGGPVGPVGRCRWHPDAGLRFDGSGRCAWGCRIDPT